MLPGRLTRTGLVTAALVVPLACGGADSGGGGAIEDNLIRPGITAINDARTLTCGTNERLLLDAIELYEVVNGDAPADEAALIDAGFLREATTDFDIVDGRLVPENPDCGTAAAPAPTDVDIVTDVGSIPTVDELFGLYDAEFIAQVGGPACARQLAVIAVAGLRYEDREGTAPLTFDDLQGDLDEPVTDWTYDAAADQLAPADGSPCTLGALEPDG